MGEMIASAFPEGDADLAATMRSAFPNAPREAIVSTDWMATAFNRERLGWSAEKLKRVVTLECRHQVVTSNRRHARCPYCHYLIVNGYDYDAFRNLGAKDPLEGHWEEVFDAALTEPATSAPGTE